jgi:DNA-binding response OmpR family regulator
VKNILVVDDDVSIHTLITAIIQIIGDVRIESAFNGREALEKAQADQPDLIISDVTMPDMDGLALCHKIRENPQLADTPILLLTARADTQDKYHGFLQGADDYLVKPFDPTELQLRIKALLRRSSRAAAPEARPEVSRLSAGPLTLNLHRYLAEIDGREIKLTASEFAILRYLVEHPDQVVSVETLLSAALDYPQRMGNPQVIHTHMKNIRSKLRTAGQEPTFLSSSRRGYMLVTAAAKA